MLTGHKIREARELLGWSRADLARNAFLPLAVVEVVEDHESTFMLLDGQGCAIREAFERAGVEFGAGNVKLREGRR